MTSQLSRPHLVYEHDALLLSGADGLAGDLRGAGREGLGLGGRVRGSRTGSAHARELLSTRTCPPARAAAR